MYLRCSLFVPYSIYSCTLSFYNDIWLILCMYVSINKCNYLIELRQARTYIKADSGSHLCILAFSIHMGLHYVIKCVLYIVVKGPDWRRLLLMQGETSMIQFFLDSLCFIIVNHTTFSLWDIAPLINQSIFLTLEFFFLANFKINHGRNQVMRYWTI